MSLTSVVPSKVMLTAGLLLSLLVCAAYFSGVTAMVAPFGATCALLAVLPKAPFCQGRVIVISHVICVGVGAIASFIPLPDLAVVLGASWLSVIGMVFFRSLHAPAVAHTVILILGSSVIPNYVAVALVTALGLAAWSFFYIKHSEKIEAKLA
jgi:CBS-domain-containing membrane protein